MRWAGRPAGRRPDVDARRPPLHHGCVRLAATTTTHHTWASYLSSALSLSMAHGISGDDWGIGSELAFALLGTGARRTAPVLACLWRIGRRAPTRRRAVRSSPRRHRHARRIGFDAHCSCMRELGQGMREGRKEVAVSLRLVSAITLAMHGCLFW